MASIFDRLISKPSTAMPSPASDGELDPEGDRRSAEHPNTYTPRQVKDAVLELLKYGMLEEQRKPNIYREILAQRGAIARTLEPLDLVVRIDEIRGVAYLAVAEQAFDATDGGWAHPLVRRQRLNLEQSLLVAILRLQFVAHEQQAGVGAGNALVTVDDLLPQLQLYLGDPGSDAQEQKRLRALLDQLKGHGIVSDVDEHDRVCIRPVIAHLANPENLQNLLGAFKQEASQAQPKERSSDEVER